MNVATRAVMRSISKVVGADVINDAIAFFQAFEGMEEGFKQRAARVDELLSRRTSTAFVLVASPKADTVAEAGYFAEKLGETGIEVRGLIVNRMQPDFAGDGATGSAPEDRVAGAGRRRLAGTGPGGSPHRPRRCRQLAPARRTTWEDWPDRVSPAPVVRVPVQPFEVTDIASLEKLGQLLRTALTRGAGPVAGADSSAVEPLGILRPVICQ